MTTAALIVAAGSGSRFGGIIPKQYMELDGKSVLWHSAQAFLNHPDISIVQVVISAEHIPLYHQATAGMTLPSPVIGGARRQDSVIAGMNALKPHNPDKILIHDAARPWVSSQIISSVLSALDESDGVIPVIPVQDTIKILHNGHVLKTPDRATLFAAQTPQGFNFSRLLAAYASLPPDALTTDDASVMEHADYGIRTVAGDENNRKITYEGDL